MIRLLKTNSYVLVLQAFFLSSSIFADFQYPVQGGEFRLTVVDYFPVTPQSGEFMLENTVGLPESVLADVIELYSAIDALPIPASQRDIRTSSDGRSVCVTIVNPLVGNELDQEGPTGVWIFPDWRDASTVRFYPNFSRVRLLNGQYAMLIYDRPGDINTTIVDVNQLPIGEETNYWRVRGMWRDSIHVGSNGFWAGINWSNTLHTGQFGADPIAASGQSVPAFSDLNNSFLTRDGLFLVLEPSNGDLVSVNTATMAVAGTRVGSFTNSRMHMLKRPIGNAYFTAWDSGTSSRIMLQINASGSIEYYFSPIAYSKAHRHWSPTGAYAETKEHVMPAGAIELNDIRTTLPGSSQTVPPVCGSRKETDQVGWLYWD